MVVDRIACLESSLYYIRSMGDGYARILFTSGCYSIPFPSWFWAIPGVTSPLFDFTVWVDSSIVCSVAPCLSVLMMADRIIYESTTTEAWEMGDIASFSFFVPFTSHFGVLQLTLSTNPSWFWAIHGVTSPLFDFTFGPIPVLFSPYRTIC
ncbi:hypothetical protein EDD22DRAFT_969463 [Suillus occidentalis]|nr:hypothetical protein EDD22DRAFT_969463 [Suillus occidentalis]